MVFSQCTMHLPYKRGKAVSTHQQFAVTFSAHLLYIDALKVATGIGTIHIQLIKITYRHNNSDVKTIEKSTDYILIQKLTKPSPDWHTLHK